MLALSIGDTKDFMAKLLKTASFDDFRVKNVVVDGFVRLEITAEDPTGWGKVRGYIFDFIKGNEAPKSIKVVLWADPAAADVADALALFLNIMFENGKITMTTGMSKKTFTLDKEGEVAWDGIILQFLSSAQIGYTNNI